MSLALEQAGLAAAEGEIPVGAVVVKDGAVIGVGRNQTITLCDPTAHAEVMALRDAAKNLKNFRLENASLYVTLEPCAMCSGAVLHGRIKRLVYGVSDPKTGVAGSVMDIFASKQLNHQTQVQGGVLASECQELLQRFFATIRLQKRERRPTLREDALRTPDSAFKDLVPDNDAGHFFYTQSGHRMHYRDTGSPSAQRTLLCIPELGSWSWQFQPLLDHPRSVDWRIVIPDLIGCGMSDKPKKSTWHSLERHVESLSDLVNQLQIDRLNILALGNANAIASTLQKSLSLDHDKVIFFDNAATEVPLVREAEVKRGDLSTPRRALTLKQLACLEGVPPSIRRRISAPFPDQGYAAVLEGMLHHSLQPYHSLSKNAFRPTELSSDKVNGFFKNFTND
ncbi:tRNA adenosine(34) deaminase TadA [Rhodoferax sp.]|uniref:tRNA adenosine(34) deaminase TadA n=1 Tax=Rhodoferax sp. TaxID=50421 RepID=UPI0025FAA164|nr:tRNA adenosine(34) deaminase TadA [Rhodoferax sp.]